MKKKGYSELKSKLLEEKQSKKQKLLEKKRKECSCYSCSRFAIDKFFRSIHSDLRFFGSEFNRYGKLILNIKFDENNPSQRDELRKFVKQIPENCAIDLLSLDSEKEILTRLIQNVFGNPTQEPGAIFWPPTIQTTGGHYSVNMSEIERAVPKINQFLREHVNESVKILKINKHLSKLIVSFDENNEKQKHALEGFFQSHGLEEYVEGFSSKNSLLVLFAWFMQNCWTAKKRIS